MSCGFCSPVSRSCILPGVSPSALSVVKASVELFTERSHCSFLVLLLLLESTFLNLFRRVPSGVSHGSLPSDYHILGLFKDNFRTAAQRILEYFYLIGPFHAGVLFCCLTSSFEPFSELSGPLKLNILFLLPLRFLLNLKKLLLNVSARNYAFIEMFL